ncbi:hypothetical protein GGTG_09299 [Gaeumannomyces tritici R3-111a-1]|uniref:Uncharacterized protein n=1 Tax=Gaeumannomyces tritici (strain R3-111a-1) TaxID=644352 RepID=J3P702_GAET3|nr:hypothetical protein GGTG_09299 [Gaeumannomyces tritici R3-111a-1]EJT72433.1 hypothetical protein GGTG_09299 [Gaeumannomyces tritici R3-111a-1]
MGEDAAPEKADRDPNMPCHFCAYQFSGFGRPWSMSPRIVLEEAHIFGVSTTKNGLAPASADEPAICLPSLEPAISAWVSTNLNTLAVVLSRTMPAYLFIIVVEIGRDLEPGAPIPVYRAEVTRR